MTDQTARMYSHATKLSRLRQRILGQVAGIGNPNHIPNTSDSAVLSESGVDEDNTDQPDIVCTGISPAPNRLYLNANQTAKNRNPESSYSFVSSRRRIRKKGKNQGWIRQSCVYFVFCTAHHIMLFPVPNVG